MIKFCCGGTGGGSLIMVAEMNGCACPIEVRINVPAGMVSVSLPSGVLNLPSVIVLPSTSLPAVS